MAQIGRQLGKQRDLQGLTFGLMRVGDWITRQPLRWNCVCKRCGIAQIFDHTTLLRYEHSASGPRCLNDGCGKEALMEALAETPAKVRQRERQKQAEAQHQRETAETERLQALKDENAKHQRALAELTRERIAKLRDDAFRRDASTPNLSEEQAAQYNIEQLRAFAKSRRDAFLSPANLDALDNYFERNQVGPGISAQTMESAFDRLNAYGFLEQAPKPQPRPQPKTVGASPAPSAPAPAHASDMIQGWDPATGAQRGYSNYEINRMSSDQFRRVFRIVKADLELPNVGP